MRCTLENEQLTPLLVDRPHNPRAPCDEQQEDHHVRDRDERAAEALSEKSLLLSHNPEHRKDERNDHRAGKKAPRHESRRAVIDDESGHSTVQLREQETEGEYRQRKRRAERHAGEETEAVEIAHVECVADDCNERDDENERREE